MKSSRTASIDSAQRPVAAGRLRPRSPVRGERLWLCLFATPFLYEGQTAIAARFIEQGHRAESAQALGRSGLVQADLTGDGVHELVFDGTIAEPRGLTYLALTAVSPGDAGAQVGSSLVDTGQPYEPGKLLAWHSATGDKIVTITRAGTVTIHAGFPLREERRFDCTTYVTSAAIGDVDGDGLDELVVGNYEGINICALDTGQWLRGYPVQGVTDIALAQLDADPALEMILGGTIPGLVVDGATLATDWSYVDGFGSSIALGKLGSQGPLRWVGNGGGSYRFSVFQANPWSPLWSAAGDFTRIAAVAGPAGHDRIVVADWRNAVHAYDSVTQQPLFRIAEASPGLPVNALSGFSAVASSEPEIAIAASAAGPEGRPSAIVLADVVDGIRQWRWDPTRGPYTATAWGDVDGDGRDELVAATQLTYYGGAGGNVAIFDASSDRQEWRSPIAWPSTQDFMPLSTSRVQLRRRVAGAGQDIVLIGQTGVEQSSHLIVIDGVTRAITFDRFGGFLENFVDLALVARADGGEDDFALGVEMYSTGPSMLQRRSGVDGALLWQSPYLSGTVLQVLAVPPTSSATAELIAVMPDGLYAHDLATGEARWTLPAPNQGAAYIETGTVAAELAVFADSGRVAFYDASTRAFLREFALPPPVRAITTLDGNVRRMIAAADGRLVLIDGSTGQLLAQSTPIAAFRERGAHIAVRRLSDDVWQLASGTSAALYRHRLELNEAVFADGFETTP